MAQFQGVFPADELVPASCGIMSVATVVEHTDSPEDSHWINGYSQDTIAGPTIRLLSSRSGYITANDKGLLFDGTQFPRYFDVQPFFIEAESKRSTLGILAQDPLADVKAQLEASTQKAVERELWEGYAIRQDNSDGVYLRRHSQTLQNGLGPIILTSGTGVAPKKALTMLEAAIGKSPTGGGGVIHMTRESASSIVGGGIGFASDAHDDGFMLTNLGTPVSIGSGYTGTGPLDVDNTTNFNNLGTTRWAYATGPVTVHLAPVELVNESLNQGFNARTNDSTVKAQRAAAVHFDTSIFFAAQITLPDVP